MTVTALLVSHDGARWLPAVLAGLRDQQRPPERVLAVDTGSDDGSIDLLVNEFGLERVRQARGGFGSAVRHALPDIDTEWIWLLHDDSTPAPGALAALLRVAEESGAEIIGAKLREWPSLRRLLEVGVTISGSAGRETGLERGEYDQGQHDQVRQVLAVNTAGMLVRRSVLEALGGFDEELPVFGADLDFGWRAARSGLRTVVAPDAVVFHAEAARHGRRDATLRAHRDQRAAGMFVLLANASAGSLWWRWLRLLIGGLLRALGLLLARAPGAARDEIAALAAVHGRPGRLRRARAARRDLGDTPDGLLAPWWLPVRHGLDYVSDVASAAVSQGRDVAERRRGDDFNEFDDFDGEDDLVGADDEPGWFVRTFTNPIAVGAVVALVLFLVGARVAIGAVAGGALAPAPDTAGAWWRLLTEGWHHIGQGTDAPAPAYLLPLAIVGTVLGGGATAAVSAVLLLAVPLGAWGAWRFAGAFCRLATRVEATRAVRAWAAAAFAVVPLASGAWGQGRLGIVVSTALLPWCATAAFGLAASSADRRWRAGWRTGLLLAVITAFTPGAWPMTVLVVVAVALSAALLAPAALARPSGWGPLVAVVIVTPILLLPGAIGMLQHGLSGLLTEAGLPMPAPNGWELLTGRLPGPAAPVWLGVVLIVAAVAALIPAGSRLAVAACWLVAALSGFWALLISRVRIELPSGEVGVSLGFSLVLAQFALVAACALALHELFRHRERANPGRSLRGAGARIALLATAVVPVGGFVWWLTGDNELATPPVSDVPAHIADAAAEEPSHGVLVVEGALSEALTWRIHRGDGLTLGEPEILALAEPDADLNRTVAELFTNPQTEVIESLASHGVLHIVFPAPADPGAMQVLDAAGDLTRASTSDREVAAWRLDVPVPDDAIDGSGPAWLPWLIALQSMALVVVLVLCGPTRRGERR